MTSFLWDENLKDIVEVSFQFNMRYTSFDLIASNILREKTSTLEWDLESLIGLRLLKFFWSKIFTTFIGVELWSFRQRGSLELLSTYDFEVIIDETRVWKFYFSTMVLVFTISLLKKVPPAWKWMLLLLLIYPASHLPQIRCKKNLQSPWCFLWSPFLIFLPNFSGIFLVTLPCLTNCLSLPSFHSWTLIPSAVDWKTYFCRAGWSALPPPPLPSLNIYQGSPNSIWLIRCRSKSAWNILNIFGLCWATNSICLDFLSLQIIGFWKHDERLHNEVIQPRHVCIHCECAGKVTSWLHLVIRHWNSI